MLILTYKFFFGNCYFSEIILFLFINIMILNSVISFFVKSPIYSLLFLIFNYLVAGFLFILNNFIFLGFIFMLIYIGAVSILLLFTLMLLNLRIIYYKNFNKFYVFILIISVIFLEFIFLIIINKNYNLLVIESNYFFDWFLILKLKNDLFNIALNIYSKNSILVFFSSFLLLMSLIASVNIVNTLKDAKKQNAFIQLKKYSKNFLN